MRKPHQSHRLNTRRLGIERCEPRRVLSADPLGSDPFVGGTQPNSFSFSSDYLHAASSNGWTAIDADSDVVSIPVVASNQYVNGAGRYWGVFVSDTPTTNEGGRVQIDVDEAFARFDQSLGHSLVFNGDVGTGTAVDISDFFEPDLADGYLADPSGDDLYVPAVPADPIDFGSENDHAIDPGPAEPPSTSATVDDTVSEESNFESQQSTVDDLPPRREPLNGIGAMERVVTSKPPAGVDRPGAGLIDLAQLLEPSDQQVAVVAANNPEAVPVVELPARDAALAVESWVRSIPTTTPPSSGAVPDKTLRVDEAEAPAQQKPVEATDRDQRPTTVQTGQPIQPVRSASPTVADDGDAEQVAVPFLDERAPAYRLAVAAFSALMGGGLIRIVNQKTTRPGCLEHPRRRSEG